MQTRLLKEIRRSKRFIIEHRYAVSHIKHSGWWYLLDNRVNRMVRHKRLKNVLHEFVKLRKAKKKLQAFIMLLCIFIIACALCSCKTDQVEVWNPGSCTPEADSLDQRRAQLMYLTETGMTPEKAEKYLDSVNKK